MKIKLDLMVFILEILLPKTIKNGAYVINIDEYADVGTNCIALYVKIMKLFTLIVLVCCRAYS